MYLFHERKQPESERKWWFLTIYCNTRHVTPWRQVNENSTATSHNTNFKKVLCMQGAKQGKLKMHKNIHLSSRKWEKYYFSDTNDVWNIQKITKISQKHNSICLTKCPPAQLSPTHNSATILDHLPVWKGNAVFYYYFFFSTPEVAAWEGLIHF